MADSITILTYPVAGMTCAACAASVEKILMKQEEVSSANVNLANHTVSLRLHTGLARPEAYARALKKAGFELITADNPSEAEEKAQSEQLHHFRQSKKKAILALMLSIPLFWFGMIWMHKPYSAWVSALLCSLILVFPGQDFFRVAWKQSLGGRANMDSLVALSSLVSWLFSMLVMILPGWVQSMGLGGHYYFETSGLVVSFVLLGRFLEERARLRTGRAIRELMELQPTTVLRLNGIGEPEEVPAHAVVPGDRLLIRPGSTIPADGKVEEGSSWVAEQMITGEPLPVFREKGMTLTGGTLNQSGSLVMRVDATGGNTLLSGIIRMTREAQSSKAPVQRLADRVAGIFVPIVLLLALASLTLWWVAGGEEGVSMGLRSFITMLVIACPCALGLATPTAIIAGIGAGARTGVLFRNASDLERFRLIDTFVFDKTGTLTAGKLKVIHREWNCPENKWERLESMVASIEAHSDHPLARAICTHFKRDGQIPHETAGIAHFPGQGIQAFLGKQEVLIGTLDLMKARGHEIPPDQLNAAKEFENKGFSIVFVQAGESGSGWIALGDELQSEARDLVNALHSFGIETIILSGDHTAAVERKAREAGIGSFQAGMLPAEKAGFIKRLQEQGRIVGMAGDGINDGPALAQADISVAMGMGSAFAREAAGVTLPGNKLMNIVRALELSGQTMRIVKQNLFWAFFYNLLALPIAAGLFYPFTGWVLSPAIAGAAMALSSVSVVSNSLRLNFKKSMS